MYFSGSFDTGWSSLNQEISGRGVVTLTVKKICLFDQLSKGGKRK